MGWVVKWKREWDVMLLERFADEKNAVLAKELGVSERTVERHARELGLRKSEAFVRMVAKEASMAAEYRMLMGQKRTLSRPGGRPFQKGHRLDAEVEAKRVQAIRDRAWDERVRLMHGMVRKTRWKMVPYLEKSK